MVLFNVGVRIRLFVVKIVAMVRFEQGDSGGNEDEGRERQHVQESEG